jgi:hypothetical protein
VTPSTLRKYARHWIDIRIEHHEIP